jgi:hypothetical protein
MHLLKQQGVLILQDSESNLFSGLPGKNPKKAMMMTKQDDTTEGQSPLEERKTEPQQ